MEGKENKDDKNNKNGKGKTSKFTFINVHDSDSDISSSLSSDSDSDSPSPHSSHKHKKKALRSDSLKLLRSLLTEEKKDNRFEKIAYYSEWVRWFFKSVKKVDHELLVCYINLVVLMGECNRDHGWDACKTYLHKFLAREKKDLKRYGDDMEHLRSTDEYDMTIFVKTVMLHLRVAKQALKKDFSTSSSNNNNNNNNNANRNDHHCFKCNETGYFVKDCLLRESNVSSSSSTDSNGVQTK
jgi:hypothetical protein